MNKNMIQVVPDFSGTCHMYQGATFPAAIVDAFDASHKSRIADMIAVYIGLSRMKTKEGLLIMQAFSPGLFSQGPLPGPTILMLK